jgi:hypothetical protein
MITNGAGPREGDMVGLGRQTLWFIGFTHPDLKHAKQNHTKTKIVKQARGCWLKNKILKQDIHPRCRNRTSGAGKTKKKWCQLEFS